MAAVAGVRVGDAGMRVVDSLSAVASAAQQLCMRSNPFTPLQGPRGRVARLESCKVGLREGSPCGDADLCVCMAGGPAAASGSGAGAPSDQEAYRQIEPLLHTPT